MKTEAIQKKLLDWYTLTARSLPWRGLEDAYAIWISEVMLQQTQVETVIPYFMHWMRTFPDVLTLADAPADQVLKLWEGLGYYTRARNIHKAARIIVNEYGGHLPGSVAELRKLPGIGAYIAGAIASIAFSQHEPALDGNGMRVLSRLEKYQVPVNTTAGRKYLTEMLRGLLPSGQAGRFNQAFMDLGALVCLPRSPRCDVCPLSQECLARQEGVQEDLPIKNKRKAGPLYQVVAAVIREETRVLIDKRQTDGLLGGLWEFPGGKVDRDESYQQALVREIKEELGVAIAVGDKLGEYAHAYTHFKVNVHAFYAHITAGHPQALVSECIEWVEIDQLEKYPMGKVDRSISTDLKNHISV